MKRKLIQQGPGSLTVYLPKKWIEEKGLGKGDEVDISEIDGKVVINSESLKRNKKVVIEIEGNVESYIRSRIVSAYRAGYDSFQIKIQNDTQKKEIEKLVSEKLIGFEITSNKKDELLIESITEPDENQFDNILNKLFMNIEELFESTLKLASKKEKTPEEPIENIEDRITRYDNFCRRVLIKKRFDSRAVLLWAFLVQLNHAQREIYLANKIFGKNMSISKNSIEFIGEIKEYYLNLKEVYFSKNTGQIAKLHTIEKDLIYNRGYKLLTDVKSKEVIFVHHLLSGIRNFYQATSALTGLILEG